MADGRGVGRPRLPLSVRAVASLYEDGHSSLTVARLLGVSPYTVLRRLREAGIPRRPPGHPNYRPVTGPHQDEAIVQDYVAGLPMAAIVRSHGVSAWTVLRRARAAGVAVRLVGRPPGPRRIE